MSRWSFGWNWNTALLLFVTVGFLGCKQRQQEDASDVKVQIPISARKISQPQIRQMIQMIRSAAANAKGGKGSLKVRDTFSFFDMTDEEISKVEASRSAPTTVVCKNGKNDYCLLESVGKKISLPLSRMQNTSVWFDKKVRLHVKFSGAKGDEREIMEICRIDGVQAFTVALAGWATVNGFYGDGRENAGDSLIDLGYLGSKYPNCVYPN